MSEKHVVDFEKEQILKSQKYKEKADLLRVALENEKKYTLKEVDEIIKRFMKGKVI